LNTKKLEAAEEEAKRLDEEDKDDRPNKRKYSRKKHWPLKL
jgi:hypothetical protein